MGPMGSASPPDRPRHDGAPPAAFDVAVEADRTRTRLIVSGEVDAHTGRELEALGAAHLGATDHPDLVIDCAAVTHLDSYGLRVLIELRRVAEEHGGHMRVERASPAVQRLLRLSGLDHFTR